ncbi:hypothetical protein Tco_0635701 [Tanacetum coccineum]
MTTLVPMCGDMVNYGNSVMSSCKSEFPTFRIKIMPPRVMTRSAGWPAAVPRGGGTGGRVGREGRRGDNRNQSSTAINDNIRGDVRNVIMNNGRRGCTYNKFLACNPKEYDGKGGAIVYSRWIEKMESVQDMSGWGMTKK